MILTCPACQTRYMVPATSLRDGRLVRCTRCSHEWFQPAPTAAQKMAESKASQPPRPDPMEARRDRMASGNTQASVPSTVPAVATSARQARRSFYLSLFASALMLVGLGSALVILRADIMDGLPWTRGMYGAIGLGDKNAAANDAFAKLTQGLVIPTDKLSREVMENPQDPDNPILILRGEVRNDNKLEKELPPIRVTLLDETGGVIDSWPVHVEKTVLEPGERTTWMGHFYNIPFDKVASIKAVFDHHASK
ncbi:MAG: hypothetical protein GC134_06130 [Proteobacteria bacterium]|nr:hypothetical protein [Pseudomonadota bacterium]